MSTIIRRRKLGAPSVRGISKLSVTGIDWCLNAKGIPVDDVYIRWGCTSSVPNKNAKVINSATAIHRVSDKLGFRRILEEHELCPKTWFSYRDVPLNEIPKQIVVRTRVHAQGRGLWLVNSLQHLVEVCDKLGEGNYYLSKYIPKVAEYRVFCANGRAVTVTKKTPADTSAIAWNTAKGGSISTVKWDDWPLQGVRKAIEAFKLSKLDFGGVDVMVDKHGNCTILEINSAPSCSPYRQKCMAKVLDHMVQNGTKNIPLVKERGGYLKFIHPAICNRARV